MKTLTRLAIIVIAGLSIAAAMSPTLRADAGSDETRLLVVRQAPPSTDGSAQALNQALTSGGWVRGDNLALTTLVVGEGAQARRMLRVAVQQLGHLNPDLVLVLDVPGGARALDGHGVTVHDLSVTPDPSAQLARILASAA